MSKRKGSNAESSDITKQQKITQYLKTNIIRKTTEDECLIDSQDMDFTLEFPINDTSPIPLIDEKQTNYNSNIDINPNSVIDTIPISIIDTNLNPISDQPTTDDAKPTTDIITEKIIDTNPKPIFLPNRVVSLPVTDKIKTVINRSLVNLDDFKNKSLDEDSYNMEGPYIRNGSGQKLHHIILGSKAPPGQVVDHINGDKTDNRRENLRFATNNLNSQNKDKQTDATSKYIGVSYHDGENKWKCQSRWNNAGRHLGVFDMDDEIEAARTYDKFVISVYGKGAQTNTKLYPNETILTDEEVEKAVQSKPEDYLHKKQSELPKHIYYNNNGRSFATSVNGVRKYAKTLELILLKRDKMLAEQQKSKSKKAAKQSIERNIDGVAIIVTNKNGGDKKIIAVDDRDYYFLKEFGWCASINKGLLDIYAKVNGKIKRIHHIVWEVHRPDRPITNGVSILHKNDYEEVDFDARLENLQYMTHR